MKFSEMKYERPDAEKLKEELTALTEKLSSSESYEAAREVFLECEKLNKHIETLSTLVSIRHSIDTRDKFYEEEQNEAAQHICRITGGKRNG